MHIVYFISLNLYKYKFDFIHKYTIIKYCLLTDKMAEKRIKKRTYLEDYLQFGFTSIVTNGIEKPQCVICLKVLSAESMKPFQLKIHLEKEHANHTDKDTSFFQRKADNVKRSKIDATGDLYGSSKSTVEASYIVALRIAKAKKPHTIGEELILPCAKDIVRLMLGTVAERKLNSISLSDNTVQRRIYDLSEDIKIQVVEQIKEAPTGWFCLQLDESTDVASCARNFLFSFDTSTTLILRMNFYSANIWIHKHVELTYIASYIPLSSVKALNMINF